MSVGLASSTGSYLLRLIPPGTTGKQFFQNYVMTSVDQNILELAAKEDSCKYAYNGLVSFLAGLSSIRAHQAAWAVTKMYYSAFYVARASLCKNGRIIFHVPKEGSFGHTQFEMVIGAGQTASVSTIPSTHKLVSSRFRQAGYPSFMSGLVVDEIDPIDWLMEQRELWQYRAPRFPDPEFPDILRQFDIQKTQRLLSAYDDDKLGLYLSDPAHALVAIPFRLVTWYISTSPFAKAGVLQSEDLAFLRRSCIAGKYHLTSISRFLED